MHFDLYGFTPECAHEVMGTGAKSCCHAPMGSLRQVVTVDVTLIHRFRSNEGLLGRVILLRVII